MVLVVPAAAPPCPPNRVNLTPSGHPLLHSEWRRGMGRGGAWQQTTGFHRELVLRLQPERRRQYPSESREAGEGGEGTTGKLCCEVRQATVDRIRNQATLPLRTLRLLRGTTVFSVCMVPVQRGTANARTEMRFVPLIRTVPTTRSDGDTLALEAEAAMPGARLRIARLFGAVSMLFAKVSTSPLDPESATSDPSKTTVCPVVR